MKNSQHTRPISSQCSSSPTAPAGAEINHATDASLRSFPSFSSWNNFYMQYLRNELAHRGSIDITQCCRNSIYEKPVTLSWVVFKQPLKKILICFLFFSPVKFIIAEFCTVFFSRVGTVTTILYDQWLMTLYIVTKSLFLFCCDLWFL